MSTDQLRARRQRSAEPSIMHTSQALLSLGRQLGHSLAADGLRLGVPHEHPAEREQQRICAVAHLLVIAGHVRLPACVHLQSTHDCQCCGSQACAEGTSQHLSLQPWWPKLGHVMHKVSTEAFSLVSLLCCSVSASHDINDIPCMLPLA